MVPRPREDLHRLQMVPRTASRPALHGLPHGAGRHVKTYTVCHMVPRPREDLHLSVCHMVPEDHVKTCTYTVCHMVPETREELHGLPHGARNA